MTTTLSLVNLTIIRANPVKLCMGLVLVIGMLGATNSSHAEQPIQAGFPHAQLAQAPATTVNRNIAAPAAATQPALQPASQPQPATGVRSVAPTMAIGTAASNMSNMAELAGTEARVRTLEMQLKKLQDELKALKTQYAGHVHKVNSGLPHMNYTTMRVNDGRDSFLIPHVVTRGGQDHTITVDPPTQSAGNN